MNFPNNVNPLFSKQNEFECVWKYIGEAHQKVSTTTFLGILDTDPHYDGNKLCPILVRI